VHPSPFVCAECSPISPKLDGSGLRENRLYFERTMINYAALNISSFGGNSNVGGECNGAGGSANACVIKCSISAAGNSLVPGAATIQPFIASNVRQSDAPWLCHQTYADFGTLGSVSRRMSGRTIDIQRSESATRPAVAQLVRRMGQAGRQCSSRRVSQALISSDGSLRALRQVDLRLPSRCPRVTCPTDDTICYVRVSISFCLKRFSFGKIRLADSVHG